MGVEGSSDDEQLTGRSFSLQFLFCFVLQIVLFKTLIFGTIIIDFWFSKNTTYFNLYVYFYFLTHIK